MDSSRHPRTRSFERNLRISRRPFGQAPPKRWGALCPMRPPPCRSSHGRSVFVRSHRPAVALHRRHGTGQGAWAVEKLLKTLGGAAMTGLQSTETESASISRLPPFRADVVGSFLRSEKLKEARKQLLGPQTSDQNLGPHDNDELRRIEDDCIRE